MEFKQIRTFVVLAEHLHFGHAAEQLGIAQPHVSRRIKQLEEDLDVQLFRRDKRNVELTEAGAVFLLEARKLLRDADIARQRVRESARGRRGHLTVSLVGHAMLGVLQTILAEFRRRYPNVQLGFHELGSVVQLDALANGTTDIAFFHPPNRTSATFEHLTLEREPLVAVLPRSHRLAGLEKIPLTELADETWVMFPRADSAPIYDRIIAVCQRAGFSPKIIQEAGPLHTRLGLVAAGFGVVMVHKSWERMPYPDIVYIPTEPTASIGLSCYWRKDDPNPILPLFIEVVRENRVPDRKAA